MGHPPLMDDLDLLLGAPGIATRSKDASTIFSLFIYATCAGWRNAARCVPAPNLAIDELHCTGYLQALGFLPSSWFM